MLTERDQNRLAKSYGLLLLWFVLNSFLWVFFHTLVGYINMGIFGYQRTNSPVGFVAGVLVGLIVGFMQWIILSKNFSISPLWILSSVIGFTTYYTINWYTAAILMGGFQQYLVSRKLNDSFLWFIVVLVSLGINGLQPVEFVGGLASLCVVVSLYGTAYGLPTSILIAWYKYKLSSEPLIIAQQDGGM